MYVQCICGGVMDKDLAERMMLERIEMIARLSSNEACRVRDKDIALHLIADITSQMIMRSAKVSVVFSTIRSKF